MKKTQELIFCKNIVYWLSKSSGAAAGKDIINGRKCEALLYYSDIFIDLLYLKISSCANKLVSSRVQLDGNSAQM